MGDNGVEQWLVHWYFGCGNSWSKRMLQWDVEPDWGCNGVSRYHTGEAAQDERRFAKDRKDWAKPETTK